MSKLYVKGDLIGKPDGIESEDLQEEFQKFGTVESVWVGRNPAGFAFVTYTNDDDRREAIEKMDDQEFKGCRLTCEPARERERRDNVKPGDWPCPGCRINNFARRDECFRCGESKPRDFGRFGGGGRGGRSRSRSRGRGYGGGGGGGYGGGGGGYGGRRGGSRSPDRGRGRDDYGRRDDHGRGGGRDDRGPPPRPRGRSRSY
jgi:hypothetical protein